MSEIKYPNGKNPLSNQVQPKKAAKARNLSKSKLGDAFEDAINDSNQYYLSKNFAAIYKKPTPVQIVKVNYPSRNKAKITEAYYRMPSTTDYNGIYREKYIDFEAKTCKENIFSFERIYPHQIAHLKTIHELGGIAFLLIEFSKKGEIYLLPAPKLVERYEDSLNGGRKSIPYEYFVSDGYQVNVSLAPRIDYLKTVDKIYF